MRKVALSEVEGHLPFAEEETGPLAEGVERRANLLHHAETPGLEHVEITPEGCHQSLVLHLVAVDPGGFLNFVAPRMASSPMIELVPDTLGDVDLAVELSKQLEVANGGETGEGRGIADDDHCWSRWRSEDHVPLRVKRRAGQDFVVVSAEDWEREQETLYVLQNKSLMEQIERSVKTHGEGTGYRPSPEELDALDRV